MSEVREVPIDSLRPHPLNEKLYPVNEEEDKSLEESMLHDFENVLYY